MADESKNKKISSTDSGFPGYLNFDKLRSESIAYLGNLSGKIWTDHNVHDPGITILEVLIYALLDLGYRTNLPAVDLFTRDPKDNSKDNNFFTPSQILANNPLTITDYRKLLVDINGVKNAWLEVEDNLPTDLCPPDNSNTDVIGVNVHGRIPEKCECDHLNGLYHVYVELEKDFILTNNKYPDEYYEIIDKIKCALMSHRNLCEDFINIKVLCKLKVGLCADVELNDDANGEEVHLKILEAIREFFSPSPKFYTLPQLLDKGKLVEEIFAGRPYNLKESHGFVDTDEFEKIALRKKIHLSDVYHILFDVPGVKNVRNLSWKPCNYEGPTPDITNWELQLPQNFIPEFDTACSGFQFFKYGMKLKLDLSKSNSLFAMNFSTNGKILYTQPSPYLDAEIPQGVYRSDIGDYYSIQNEFPHVYGISKGGLANSVSDRRKAQALQLQGFLLFFDQLLANYLTQLKNIRSLFALSSFENEDNNHTYFINELTNVPQLEKLFRFSTGTDGTGNLGSEGSILVYPTDRKNLEDLIASGKLKNTDLDRRCNDVNKDDFPEYKFCYAAVRDQNENLLRDDLLNGEYEPVIVSNYNECFFFYCFTSSTDFALISKRYYASEKEAQTAAASIKYLGTFAENYRSFLIDDGDTEDEYFSFDIELNLNAYSKYLQLIAEDETLYNIRRQGFLNHLLSRFAEQFTDYALITSDFLKPEQFQKSQIKAEEKFLLSYADLSSNRGKGYDYLCNGWNNENISGFEKRFKALCGIENWKKHYLCNFVVQKADEIYTLTISLFGSEFKVKDKMVTYEAGVSSLTSVLKNLGKQPFFIEYIDHEQSWGVFIKDDYGNKYQDQKLFPDKEAAVKYSNALQTVVSYKPAVDENIFVSRYINKINFKAYNDELLAESREKLGNMDEAQKYFKKTAPKITNYLNDSEEFIKIRKGIKLDKLIPVNSADNSYSYIDKDKFEFKPVDVIQLESVKKKFALLNHQKTIQFDSLINYDNLKLAEAGFKELLILLTSAGNYFVEPGSQGNDYKIYVKAGDNHVAVYFQSYNNKDDADNNVKEIFNEITAHTYKLSISDPIPNNWEFKYHLADPAGDNVEFLSRSNYKSEQNARAAADKFYSNISSLKMKSIEDEMQLAPDNNKKIIAHAVLPADQAEEKSAKTLQLLQYHRDLSTAIGNTSKEYLGAILKANLNTTSEQYIYKLVDKDNLLARFYIPAGTGAEALVFKNELINRFISGYNYIGISLGGDIINERVDAATNVTWYHYLIKCNNVFYKKVASADKPLILFESVKGYLTKEAAMQTFLDNYLIILSKARQETNFGVNKIISFVEILVHENDSCDDSQSNVFIPPETIYEYEGDVPKVVREIMLLAKSYPVQYIAKGKYRFSVFDPNTEMYDWRSVHRYATPQEAMQRFLFFRDLLNYSGNYYIEQSETDCRYRIYIREVLAISAHTFPSSYDAWGVNGVEKFICTAQAENGFHNYLNRTNCSYSFYVACNNTGLIHPCMYETPARRDKVLNKLYQAASFNFFDLLQEDANNKLTLFNTEKKPVANLFVRRGRTDIVDPCERLIEIFESMHIDNNYKDTKSKKFYLTNAENIKIAEPVSMDSSWAEWKQQLLQIACYFPLFRKEADDADSPRYQRRCNYYVRIKLPAFDSCEADLVTNDMCIDGKEDECNVGCYLAWKSDCCFRTCCDALQFYESALRLIGDYHNYKPVYECNCGSYGIELHTEAKSSKAVNNLPGFLVSSSIGRWLCGDNYNVNNTETGENNNRFYNKCLNEIVAINPQQYNNDNIACEAVERASKLINAEGLHLAEHILLRPRCKNADGIFEECDCVYQPRPCVEVANANDQFNICHFKWLPSGEEDPCTTNEAVCFTPGCDPYSFIATLALPAWPQRFRSTENRLVIEKLLQKEAPAHVLLRLLWLNPRDFCCFEYEFKRWNFCLAKKMCDTEYDNCDFLGLLFHKNFNKLRECYECVPCDCNDEEPVSCFEEDTNRCDDLVTQINNLYCWNKGDYDTYNCESYEDAQTPAPILKKTLSNNPVAKTKTNKVQPSSIKVEDLRLSPEAATAAKNDNRKKYLIIQARSSKYKENVKKITDAKPGIKPAENALRFLADINPDPDRYDDLINNILKNKPGKIKSIKALTLKEKHVLINNISWQYFDRICLNEKNANKITIHHALFNHLRKNKIDMHLLFADWNGKEIKAMEPAININEIKKVVI